MNPINPNGEKSYRDYLQNTPHVVLHNRPSLSIATKGFNTCVNNDRGVQLHGDSRLARGRSRVRAPAPAGAFAFFFLHPSSLLVERLFFFFFTPSPLPLESVRVIVHHLRDLTKDPIAFLEIVVGRFSAFRQLIFTHIESTCCMLFRTARRPGCFRHIEIGENFTQTAADVAASSSTWTSLIFIV